MAASTQDLAVTFLGCGSLSSAILEGILSSLSEPAKKSVYQLPGDPKTQEESATFVAKRFIACVRQYHSAALLEQTFGARGVKVLTNENVKGVESADVIILGVEPKVYEEVVSQPGMRDALTGKILVSIVGGVSTKMLANAIYGQAPLSKEEKKKGTQCQIIRVLPNTAAAVRDSMSLIIEEEKDQYPPFVLSPVVSLFKASRVYQTMARQIGPGVVDGALKHGVDRKEALALVAAAMRGAAALVASGEDPSEVRRKVATPGGMTVVGLKALEDSNVKALMEEAVSKAVEKGEQARTEVED